MNIVQTLIAPVRAQPLHFGHEYYIRQLAETRSHIVLLLNRKRDLDNPFSFEIRKKWIEDFLLRNKIENVQVPERLPFTKEIEYPLQAGNKLFTVITTNETDDVYKKLGFGTLNHHMTPLPKPAKAFILPGRELPIANTGRIIRDRLRQKLSCSHLLYNEIEIEALACINSF